MEGSLLDRVRCRCREVAQQAQFVRIDEAAFTDYLALLPRQRLTVPEMDPAIHYLGHGRDTIAYYLTLDAVNFGSGYFPEILRDPRRSGYRAIAASLCNHFTRSGPLTAEALRALSLKECASIFGPEFAAPAARELVALYKKALNNLGAYLCERFAGDFLRLVEEAGQSAERLVEVLTKIPFFDDLAWYGEKQVPFYKRAQLAAIDLQIAFAGEGAGRFDDIDRLTICADNLVPHVLRLDGVLHYRAELAARVDRGEPLAPGSPEEVEIRACAVHAGELMVDALRQRGEKVNAMLLDNLLWHRGQQPHYRDRPRHRTRTVFY